MANIDLIKALQVSTKILKQESDANVEIQFLKKNLSLFAEDKRVFYDALRSLGQPTGQQLLDEIGYNNLCIEKCKESELLSACYLLPGSKLYNKFMLMSTKRGCELTCIFVSGIRAIVISNVYNLHTAGKVQHTLKSTGKLKDLHWAPIEDLKGFTFYA